MNPKKYLRELPKYKKTWVKEKSTFGFMHDADSVYLLFESLTPSNYTKITTKKISQKESFYPCSDLYFFELFKYLKKIQSHVGPFSSNKSKKNDLKKYIKMHLLQKHSKQLKNDKFVFLTDYSELIDDCFNIVYQDGYTNISLVIQKKLGYKYYENIVYT